MRIIEDARSAMRLPAAVALVAIALAVSPARAATPVALQNATGKSGWSNSQREVAAAYDHVLDSASTVALTDAAHADVPGHASVVDCATACVHTQVLRFVADETLTIAKGPYTVVFTASPVGSPGTTTVDTFTFKLDLSVPLLPQITTPVTPGPAAPDVEIAGNATDRFARSAAGIPDYSATSGVARIELRFYNPAVAFNPLRGGSTEVFKYHRELSVACAASACPVAADWTTTVKLDPGYWTVEAFAYDLAGNRSPDSQTVSFVVLPA
jgi:hypothetical protein